MASQAEPTMNASPPSTYSSCQTRTAATRHSRKPVSEIALGVSRDSMSRLVTTAWYSRAVVGRGWAMPGGKAGCRSAPRGKARREHRHAKGPQPPGAPADPDPPEPRVDDRRAVRRRREPARHDDVGLPR